MPIACSSPGVIRRWFTFIAAWGSRAAISSDTAPTPQVPPPSGFTVVTPASATPAVARTRSTIRRTSSLRAGPGGYEGGTSASSVSNPCASNPSGLVSRRTKCRMTRPAPDSRTSVSAVSATTSVPSSRRRPGPALAVRPSSASAARGSLRQLPNAGTTPATIALAADTAAANVSTRQSSAGVVNPS